MHQRFKEQKEPLVGPLPEGKAIQQRPVRIGVFLGRWPAAASEQGRQPGNVERLGPKLAFGRVAHARNVQSAPELLQPFPQRLPRVKNATVEGVCQGESCHLGNSRHALRVEPPQRVLESQRPLWERIPAPFSERDQFILTQRLNYRLDVFALPPSRPQVLSPPQLYATMVSANRFPGALAENVHDGRPEHPDLVHPRADLLLSVTGAGPPCHASGPSSAPRRGSRTTSTGSRVSVR